MQRVCMGDLYLWQFEGLKTRAAIRHYVTDRRSVVGARELTLSYSSTPDREWVVESRGLVAEAMGVSAERFYLPSQVHETHIVNVSSKTAREELQGTDALISNERGICIGVMSADCVPILLYDEKNHAIGAVHSGWRGTVARILEKTLMRMQQEFGTDGADVLAAIGPSVSQEAYEVGEEVVTAMRQSFPGKDQQLLIPQPANKAKLNLWEANRLQLLGFGVKDKNIEIADLCTVKNNEYFFSARKGDAGRFAAGLVIR